MKKVMMISMLALSMTASVKGWPVDTLHQASVNNPFLQRLTPTLTTDYVQVGKINQHWFFGIQGGASAFIGNTKRRCKGVLPGIEVQEQRP